MPKFKDVLLGATLAAGLPMTAMAQSETAETEAAPKADVTAETVLATVGEIEVTLGHVIAAIEDLEEAERGLPDEVLLNGLAERLIQQAAISETARELTQATELRLENGRRALIAGEVLGARAEAIEISEADLQAAYDARFADFTPSKEYNASHILVATEEEAKALVEDLQGGADFAELAKEKSTGPSGPGGGSLGWFARGQMVEPFQDAVEVLEPGSVSDPVETRFGWHVIKLNETRIPEVPALDTMTGELQQEVFQQKLRQEVSDLIASTEIVRTSLDGIDPAVVRDDGLIGR